MKIKNIINSFAAIAVAVGSISCTGAYLDINRDPYGVTDDEMGRDGYNVKAALVGMMSGVISTDDNTAQFTDVLLGSALSGYLAPAKDGWNNVTIANYNATEDWYRVFMASDKIIPVIYANYRQLQNATDDPGILAIGEIVKVAAMHRVTDTYGPIPYSQIGNNGEISVPYDSQEEVYKMMLEELANAVAAIEENGIDASASTSDVIYAGNATKWIRFANSLRLRLAMRISYASEELSVKTVNDVMADEVGPIMSNDDNALFSYWGTNGNTLRVSIRYNIANHADKTVCSTEAGDSHAAAEIITYMNGYDDPRMPYYFTKTEFDNARYGEYVGLRHGIEVPSHVAVGHQYSGVVFKNGASTPVCWMNAAEVQFILAEAAAFKEKEGKGYNVSGTAQSYYEEGVRLSFEQYGAKGADEYLTRDGVDYEPDAYTDPANASYSMPQPSTITPKWDSAADFEEMQERIITQKWIANWLLGCEAWADWRRTGYPILFPASDYDATWGINESNVKAGARRMPYPRTEMTSNAVNYAAGVALLGNGAQDNMATRLWFDQKENNPSYQ